MSSGNVPPEERLKHILPEDDRTPEEKRLQIVHKKAKSMFYEANQIFEELTNESKGKEAELERIFHQLKIDLQTAQAGNIRNELNHLQRLEEDVYESDSSKNNENLNAGIEKIINAYLLCEFYNERASNYGLKEDRGLQNKVESKMADYQIVTQTIRDETKSFLEYAKREHEGGENHKYKYLADEVKQIIEKCEYLNEELQKNMPR